VTIIDGIAERIGAIRYEGLPAEAVRWAKAAILDTVGVTLAGAGEPCARIAAGVLGLGKSSGECLIFGSGQRATPLDAALINGTAAHALDFDDVSNSLGGHPSAPILPAIFALGEVLDCPEKPVRGRDFVTAYVAGFETETRIARGVHFHHYEKGWHPTATLGVFGAAAASCHLLGLDRAKTAQALAIAASLASGIKANFGTMTKPLHVGHTARNGLFAAMLACDGFTANDAALEHKQGFLMVFNGAGNFDAEVILRDWGEPYDIVRPGLGVKQHPCCGSTHPAIARCCCCALRMRSRRSALRASIHGRIPAASRIPTAPIRKAGSTPSSACNTALPARCCTAASGSSISRARRSAIRRPGH
jgi:2-methylcitrate dehydratase PrpD